MCLLNIQNTTSFLYLNGFDCFSIKFGRQTNFLSNFLPNTNHINNTFFLRQRTIQWWPTYHLPLHKINRQQILKQSRHNIQFNQLHKLNFANINQILNKLQTSKQFTIIFHNQAYLRYNSPYTMTISSFNYFS